MKTKILAAALVSAVGVVFADSTSVTNGYVIGVLPVEMKAGQADIILNIPWIEPGTNDTVTSGVAVTNLVKTAGLSEGDTLRWYDGSGYKGWVVNKDGQWEAAEIVGVGSKTEAVESDTPELMRGQALILSRSSTTATNVYLIGQTASSAVTSTLTKDQYTLIAPPAVTASEAGYLIGKLSDSDVVANNDVITFVQADGKSVSYYYYGENWWHDYIDDKDAFHHDEVTTIALPVGTGMYYLRRGDTTSITW